VVLVHGAGSEEDLLDADDGRLAAKVGPRDYQLQLRQVPYIDKMLNQQ
jgi:hypothetical protein